MNFQHSAAALQMTRYQLCNRWLRRSVSVSLHADQPNNKPLPRLSAAYFTTTAWHALHLPRRFLLAWKHLFILARGIYWPALLLGSDAWLSRKGAFVQYVHRRRSLDICFFGDVRHGCQCAAGSPVLPGGSMLRLAGPIIGGGTWKKATWHFSGEKMLWKPE